MELRRNISSKNYLFCLITVISCFVFGYVLPISIDHVENLIAMPKEHLTSSFLILSFIL